jgi:Flp pilus assembly protein TadD
LAAIAAGAGDESVAVTRATAALQLPGLTTIERAICNHILASQHLPAGRLVEATLLLEQNVQLRLSPQDWFLLGICRQRQHDLTGAIAALERVIEIDPSEPRAFQMLAEWYVIRGDDTKANAARERAKLLEANLPQQPPPP